MASAFSRTLLSEGFSKWPRSFISRKRPSRCIFFFNALRAWSTLLSRTKTCTLDSFWIRDTRIWIWTVPVPMATVVRIPWGNSISAAQRGGQVKSSTKQCESYREEQEDEAHHDVALHRNFTGRGLRNHSTGVADLGRPGRGFDLRGEDCPATDKQA